MLKMKMIIGLGSKMELIVAFIYYDNHILRNKDIPRVKAENSALIMYCRSFFSQKKKEVNKRKGSSALRNIKAISNEKWELV